MDKGYGIGAGSQNEAARQLEIHGALSDQSWKLDRAEAAVSELISRITPLLRKEDSKGSVAPTPSYSCALAQHLGQNSDRIEAIADRVGYIIGLLEI